MGPPVVARCASCFSGVGGNRWDEHRRMHYSVQWRGHWARAMLQSIMSTTTNAGPFVTLSEMPLHRPAIVQSVEDRQPDDAIARRLRELGFVDGEQVVVLALGPIGREPLLVQVGYTRFALRRSEAARVRVVAAEPV